MNTESHGSSQPFSVQIIATAREKELDNEYKTAKYLFRKTAEELKLYSRDVEIISSSVAEISENEEMLSHYGVLSPCLHNGTEECQWWKSLGQNLSVRLFLKILFRSETDKRYKPPRPHSGGW